MFNQRRKIYEQIERERNTRVIAYVTSNRQGLKLKLEQMFQIYYWSIWIK